MVALQQSCIEELMSVIATKTNSGQSVDMRRIFQNLSFDVITRAAFGARTNIQTTPRGSEGDVLMTAALDSLRQFNTGWLTYIASKFICSFLRLFNKKHFMVGHRLRLQGKLL